MNRQIFSFIIACTAMVSGPALAADADDIVALLAKVHDAYMECDTKQLQELTHPDWFGSFNTKGEFVHNAGEEEIQKRCAKGYRVDYQYEILKMEVHGNWAFVAGRAKSELIAPNGERTAADLRMCWVLSRHEGQWKRYWVHAAAMPKQ